MTAPTLLFVALPNGLTDKGAPRLSIYLTPRLAAAGSLGDFPDMLNWTGLVADKGLSLDIACGGATSTVALPRAQLRPDLWGSVFKAIGPVAPYPRPAKTQPIVVSYPVLHAHAFVRSTYRSMARAPLILSRSGRTNDSEGTALGGALSQLTFRKGKTSTLDAAISDERLAVWRRQTPTDGSPSIQRLGPGEPAMSDIPVSQVATRFAMFHRPPPAPGSAPLPKTSAEFEKAIDFHQALASIAAYPALLRALGLVFDIELPKAFVPASPDAAGMFGALSVAKITPGWGWSVTPIFSLPPTAYELGPARFAAAPATTPDEMAAGQRQPADVDRGYLNLSPDLYGLIGVDIDGAMMKAMSLADNVALVTDASRIEQVLPSLRSGGISLVAHGRAEELIRAISVQTALHEVEDAGVAEHRPLLARDLTRGYRLDVWSSLDKTWRSLHRRDGAYRFGADGALAFDTKDEEGFTQLAVTQPPADPTRPSDPPSTAAGAPQPGDDLYLHERIARWHGWSLSAPRPGRPLNRSADPALAAQEDPTAGQAITAFKMTTAFTARPGTLPRLRFGARYRMRVRVVDLAGNSVSLDAPSPDDVAAPPTSVAYHRFEPVSSPIVILRQPTTTGASLLHMVIRSFNNTPALDTTPTAETDERHLFPPKIDVLAVEHHGMFDDAAGKLRNDKATYDLVVERDKGTLVQEGQTAIRPEAQGVSPYFPDPIARGVALAGLPGAPANAIAVESNGKLSYKPRGEVEPATPSVVHVDFGGAWPDRQAARLLIRDGDGAPTLDASARLLTVQLPKATITDVPVSCFMNPADLELMGVWDWMRSDFEAQEAAAMAQSPFGDEVSGDMAVSLARTRALLTRLALEGCHDMLTPPETVTLVHATQQPLGRPTWTTLPIQHNLAASNRPADAYRPITAWRAPGSHDAVLFGGLNIHGASSARIDLDARWTDYLDDLGKPGPTTRPAADHVETIELRSLKRGMVPADAASTRFVAEYIPEFDTLWFARPEDTLQGVDAPASLAAPTHHFGDTQRRQVTYRAVAASRFSEYFSEPTLDFTRKSDLLTVDVPSSARPAAPNILYVLPTFGWQRQETTNVKTETRIGNGLRVYLNRPWFSSGVGERLGVVIWSGAMSQPDDATREKYRGYFTQWGLDPLWKGGALYDNPRDISFPAATEQGSGLSLGESDLTVDVAGHAVAYDSDRRLWFCDIQFDFIFAYAPLVRLALARYQPGSIEGAELSRVVLADVAALTPDRSASLVLDPADPLSGRLFVAGRAPTQPSSSQIEVTVEKRDAKIGGDLGWLKAAVDVVTVLPDAAMPTSDQSILWTGSILFKDPPKSGDFRIVIKEFEVHPVDPTAGDIVDHGVFGERLVYASIMMWTF